MPIKTSKELTNNTVRLISKFKSGELKPIPTGIDHLDEALLGGLLPGTVLGLAGRSGHGKSYDNERIQRNILDTEPDVIYLNCNWELNHFKILVRDISYKTKQSVKSVLFDPLDENTQKEFEEICNHHRTDNLFYQNEPVSSDVFDVDVSSLIERFPDKRIIVTIDNLENILLDKGSQKDCMDRLLYKINILKNKHFFICFIILNQMNRDYIYEISNIKNHRPNEGHLYGSDQYYKLCDVVYIKLIPSKLGIKDKFMIFGDNQYDWLEEHKTDSNGSTCSFDPYGRAFYFYIKQRQPEDEKNIKDIFIETMFKKEKQETKSHLNIPVFNQEVVKPNFDITNAFDPPEMSEDSPF